MSDEAWGKVCVFAGLVVVLGFGSTIKAMLFDPRPPAAASSGSLPSPGGVAAPVATANATALTGTDHNAISLIISQGGSQELYFSHRDYLMGRGDSTDQAASFLLGVAQMTPGSGVGDALFVGVTLRRAFSADTALMKLQMIVSADSEVPGLRAMQCAVLAAKGEHYGDQLVSRMFTYFNFTNKEAQFPTAINAVAYARAQP